MTLPAPGAGKATSASDAITQRKPGHEAPHPARSIQELIEEAVLDAHESLTFLHECYAEFKAGKDRDARALLAELETEGKSTRKTRRSKA